MLVHPTGRAVQPFNKYITGESDSVARAELDRLAKRYEWFSTARRARTLLYGEADGRLLLPLMFSPTIPPAERKRAETLETPHCEPPKLPEEDIIDRFLAHGGHRIVPDESAAIGEVPLAEVFEPDNDDIASEELAEIYRSQGLYAESKEIYRRLSLLNPEKSIYFADVIARIDEELRQITK